MGRQECLPHPYIGFLIASILAVVGASLVGLPAAPVCVRTRTGRQYAAQAGARPCATDVPPFRPGTRTNHAGVYLCCSRSFVGRMTELANG